MPPAEDVRSPEKSGGAFGGGEGAEGGVEGVGQTAVQSPEGAMRAAVKVALDAGDDALAAELLGMLRARAARGRGG